MAVLFADSFDHYTVVTDKWTILSGAPTVTAVGRNGTNGSNQPSGGRITKVLSSTPASLIVGVAFEIVTGGQTMPLLSLLQGGDDQIGVWFDSTVNRLSVRRGTFLSNTVLATYATPISLSTYYHLELKATIDPSVGSYDVRLNEISVMSASGVNTRFTASSTIDAVSLGNTSAGGLGYVSHFDDLYVCDTLGGVNNDFLGDCRVQCLFPDGAGATTGWTPLSGANYTNVDEAAPDNDTTYVSTGAAGTIDTYSMSDLAATTGSVKAVQTVIDARKDDAGTRTIAPVFRIGASDYVGSNQNIMTSYSMFLQVYQVSPATAVAWTIAEVNALNAGQKLVA